METHLSAQIAVQSNYKGSGSMKRLVSFAITVSIVFSVMLSAIPVNASNNLIAFSEEALEEAALRYYHYTKNGYNKEIAEVSNYQGDNVVIQIYEVVIDDKTTGNGHSATYDWYTVNKYTGIGTNMQGKKVVLDLPLPLEAYNDFSDEELMLLASVRWKTQSEMNWLFPQSHACKVDDSVTVRENGILYAPVVEEGISTLEDLQNYWETYFAEDCVPKSYYMPEKYYKMINGKLHAAVGGIGGDISLISTVFDHITYRDKKMVSISVKETREDWKTNNPYTKEFIYTMIWENEGWKLSKAEFTDGTPYFERFGLYDISAMHTFDYEGELNLDVTWGWDLFDKNASEYDHNLSMAGILLSAAAYSGKDTAERRMRNLGFDVINSFNFESNTRFENPAVIIGAQEVYLNNTIKYIIPIVTCGTRVGTGDGWTDIIDGCGGGFSTSAANTLRHIRASIPMIESTYGCKLTKDKTIFFLTGHSLGGAVSGVLSNNLLTYAKQENIFTYTFASPNYYTVDNCESYKNNHNIIVLGDAVPNVPWMKKRYGNDWYYDLETCLEELEVTHGVENPGWNTFFYHDLKTYLAALLSGLPKNMGSGAKSTYNLSSIHCPVDIAVYDAKGNEMGHTSGNDVIITDDSEVFIYIEGDSKFILSPIDKQYGVKFTATGDGTMTYTQSIIDAVTDEVKSTKEFSNVKLTEGKLMMAEIGGNIETENIKLFVQNEEGKTIAEVDIDGSEKSVNNNYLIIILISAIVILCISGVIVFVLLKRKSRNLKIYTE